MKRKAFSIPSMTTTTTQRPALASPVLGSGPVLMASPQHL